MPHAPCSAVVFDLDGLMFNTEELYCQVGGETLRRRGKTLTRELLDQMMGRPGRVSLQLMIDYHSLDDTVDGLVEESDEIFAEILEARLEPLPGLLPLLECLEANSIPKAIATSSRRSFVGNVLGRFHLEPRFEFVLTSEDVTRGKPDPEIYQQAARRLGLSPARVLVLEDSQNGCRAAVEAGAYAVAVPGDHSRGHDFSGARFIADSLLDPRIDRCLGLSRQKRPDRD